jgi:hypothetical protein
MALTGKTFRIFVSSTFSDLKEERNALQEKVFPRLKELCLQRGCRFQAVDLRWGVREEAGLDQQTMKICLGEIERCQKVTPRPNFIVLLGDRYGWRPLPADIPAGEYERIVTLVNDAGDKALLGKWYRRDDNAVPPVYCLLPRKIEVAAGASDEERRHAVNREAQEWGGVEARLRSILAAAAIKAGFAEEQMKKYLASATEQEIEAGAMQVADAEKHVFCYFRRIKGMPADRSASAFTDIDEKGAVDPEARSRLQALKERLRDRLHTHVHEYEADWQGTSPSTVHLDRFCDEAWSNLSETILAEIVQMGTADPVETERVEHEAFGRERARFFFGREDYLSAIAKYLGGAEKAPLALFGASGSGKSALIATAIEQAKKSRPQAALIHRFIGASPQSSDIRSLLESLCREITRACSGDETTIPSEYKELAEEFPKRLALATSAKPVIVFLDAMDQLSDGHNARSLLWLPATLPEHVRLVVSVAPSDCWEVLKKKIDASSQIELQPMPAEEGSFILDSWLKNAGRALQEAQREEVLDKFTKEGLPLHLKFAFEEARRWRSFAGIADVAPDVTGIVRQMLARLSSEVNHGPILVARSLAYLRAAKNGLSEDEAVDLLSRDDEVDADFQARSFFKPPEKRLPIVVWSRLYFDLEPYLNERSADGTALLGFFHRQLGEVIDADYLRGSDKAMIHARMAAYFAGQPLFAEPLGEKRANLRKLSELPYQQINGELWEDVYQTLTDFEFLEAKCTYSGVIIAPEGENGRKLYGGVYELMEDYRRALAVFPADKQE